MQLVHTLPYERLSAVPVAERPGATVIITRGHVGIRHPYSVPFTLSIRPKGYASWCAFFNFDQLYFETPYSGLQLLTRYCSNLRKIAESGLTTCDDEFDGAIWRAANVAFHHSSDQNGFCNHPDLASIRAKFAQKTLAELAHTNPREFHVYSMTTITGANGRRSTNRFEFRIVSRPEANHRWICWTRIPCEITDDPAETVFWFGRHLARLRGDRRPQWNPVQRQRWLDHIHLEIAGKTAAEVTLDALAAPLVNKPKVSLILGGEEATGGAIRWVAPREAFAQAACIGTSMEFSFTDCSDYKDKTVRLLFASVPAARTALSEILTGQRSRLGAGRHLRGLVAGNKGESFRYLVGLSEAEEAKYIAEFTQRHGSEPHLYRLGLMLQLTAS